MQELGALCKSSLNSHGGGEQPIIQEKTKAKWMCYNVAGSVTNYM